MPNLLRNLLVVEDNDEDFVALTRVFKSESRFAISRYHNGEEILAFLDLLQRENPASSARSLIVLLDLNLPGMHGGEVLSRMKSMPHLKAIPVVILSTSSNPKDINACYAQGANSYILKSVDFSKFEASLRIFKEYWDKTLLPGDHLAVADEPLTSES